MLKKRRNQSAKVLLIAGLGSILLLLAYIAYTSVKFRFSDDYIVAVVLMLLVGIPTSLLLVLGSFLLYESPIPVKYLKIIKALSILTLIIYLLSALAAPVRAISTLFIILESGSDWWFILLMNSLPLLFIIAGLFISIKSLKKVNKLLKTP